MKRIRLHLLALAVLALLAAPRPATAGWLCEKAEEFRGHCDACNTACLIEQLFYLGW